MVKPTQCLELPDVGAGRRPGGAGRHGPVPGAGQAEPADHPHLADTFDRLRDEHRTVADIQRRLVALLADIGTADPQRFRAELDRMSAEPNAHLDYEEESLLLLLSSPRSRGLHRADVPQASSRFASPRF